MKNIVLYILATLLMIYSETSAQKPVIDLLPSDHEPIHQNAVADTGFAGDSLVEVQPNRGQVDSVVPDKNHTPESSNVVLKNKPRKTGLVGNSILKRVTLSAIRSNRYLEFYITALKK